MHPADAVVGVILVGWWLIAPAFYDDGSVLARWDMFSASRGFSNYYDTFASNLPQLYWLDWIQHWLAQVSTSLLILRIPALACLAATWLLCRWILTRVLASSVGEDDVAVWGLASAFVVGAMAWGMTLRPEPQLALLAIGVLACTVQFLERESAAPLAAATVLVAVALSAHPTGIVSLAPFIAAAPRVFRWAREHLAVAATIVVAAGALLVVLASVGADLEQRRADVEATRLYGNAVAAWRDEISRYEELVTSQYGTPLRRESLALIALAILAFVVRRRDGTRVLLNLPSIVLGVSLFLLVATPSRWIFHFGTLLGFAAVAVASETAQLRETARHTSGWSLRPFLIVGAAVVVAVWCWAPGHLWGELDLRTLDWTLDWTLDGAFGRETRFFTLPKLAGLVPLALLTASALLVLARGQKDRLREASWRAASWTVVVISAPLVAFTAAVFVADAVKTESWTLTRQNIETLRGDLGCGLADDAMVANLPSMRSLTRFRGPTTQPTTQWIPPPPIAGLERFSLGPIRAGSTAYAPWFKLPASRKMGVFLAGAPGTAGTVELEWGRSRGGRIATLGSEEIGSDVPPNMRPDLVPWRFFPAAELPSRIAGSDSVRFALRGTAPTGSAAAVSAPVSYTNRRLAEQLDPGASSSLILPNLLTYFPCVDQPRLSDGVIEAPGAVVAHRDSLIPVFGGKSSPFEGILDLYRLTRLPLTDSAEPPDNVVLYDLDSRIPGGVRVPPDRTTVIS